ncbi:MAG: hypothetical protein J6T67_11515, partial [Paludibacteraceae bacterium]|nr:hypothetical protein [Paludibacteraceae bacterium]
FPLLMSLVMSFAWYSFIVDSFPFCAFEHETKQIPKHNIISNFLISLLKHTTIIHCAKVMIFFNYGLNTLFFLLKLMLSVDFQGGRDFL